MTARRTWKQLEERICRKFGGKRNPLSGSNSQHGTSSDCIEIDPELYIEVKLRGAFSHHTLFKDVEKKAKGENKIPLLVTHVKNERGELVIMRLDDFFGFFSKAGGDK